MKSRFFGVFWTRTGLDIAGDLLAAPDGVGEAAFSAPRPERFLDDGADTGL